MVRRRARPAPPEPGGGTGTMHTGGAAEAVPGRGVGEPTEHARWEDRTRVVLSPVAAPSILGLFGFAGATMMVGAWQADWYGNPLTPLILWPFALMFGGVMQLVATVWSYRARDGLATAMHGTWGAFWLAYGVLFMLVSLGAYPAALAPVAGDSYPGFAFWWVALAVITGLGAIAALGVSMALTGLLIALAAGAGFTAAGYFAPSTWSLEVGGWLFVASAVLALYTAAAMMFEGTFGRTILPVGKRRRATGVPGGKAPRSLEYAQGQPGVKSGQ
ncbi:GPR1/FUN34/YaaH family transporter [Spirillospora sp. NPDC048819]|uniref:acetate uptake transporter family protein n=1 Tax=Spirillospora sp. NPDC048819 TaxID=3155268 RepID=UPI0033C71603